MLVKGLIRMDNILFQEIYKRYYRKLFCYALSLCRNKDDAEDLVSETFVRALLSWQGSGTIEAWLYKVLKNLYIDETKRKRHYAETDPGYIENIASMTNSGSDEKVRWLYRKIMQMKSLAKEILFLTVTSGLKDQEIAELTHVSVSNLRVIRHRAKESLKDMARKEGLII